MSVSKQSQDGTHYLYTQYVFVMLVLLASARVVTLADANRTSVTNTYCCVYNVKILLMMDSGPGRNM